MGDGRGEDIFKTNFIKERFDRHISEITAVLLYIEHIKTHDYCIKNVGGHTFPRLRLTVSLT